MSKAKLHHNRMFQQNLRRAKSANPKVYWNMLNVNRKCHQKNRAMPSLAELYKHFKDLSVEDDVNNVEPENIDLENAFQQMDDLICNN